VREWPKQVSKQHYDFSTYVEKHRWISLWHQIDEILKWSPKCVLEIGTGSGVLGAVLKHLGIGYFSVDIDPALTPDILASVTEIPFADHTVDIVCCFEVLEHIPFERFSTAIAELGRVARQAVIVSLPDAKVVWSYSIYLPKRGQVNFSIPRPTLGSKEHVFDGQHYWEVNTKGISLALILSEMSQHGLSVLKTYRVEGNAYHRFFILQPRSG
jgi:SAM-dependent methyltransferase